MNSSWSAERVLDKILLLASKLLSSHHQVLLSCCLLDPVRFLFVQKQLNFSIYNFYSGSVPEILWSSAMEGYNFERIQFWQIVWCSHLVQYFNHMAKGKSFISGEQNRKGKTWDLGELQLPHHELLDLSLAHTCLKCSISRYESWWNFTLCFHISLFILLAFLASAHNICNPASLK